MKTELLALRDALTIFQIVLVIVNKYLIYIISPIFFCAENGKDDSSSKKNHLKI
jgi:hypothetical protein